MNIALFFLVLVYYPQNVYLPTMPQDHLAEVRKAGGTFYGEI